MALIPPAELSSLLCELAGHERRRLSCGAKAIGTPEHSNDTKICAPESTVFERPGESTRQDVAGKLPSGRITKRHNAASGDKLIVVEKLHYDEAQCLHFAIGQAQFEQWKHSNDIQVRASKSLNIKEDEILDKMFPEYCPSEASTSGNKQHFETTE